MSSSRYIGQSILLRLAIRCIVLLWDTPLLLKKGNNTEEGDNNQSAFTCLKLTIERLEQGVKCVQS